VCKNKLEPTFKELIKEMKFPSCVGCGYCCMAGPCEVARRRYGIKILDDLYNDDKSCPSLFWNGEMYRCQEHADYGVRLAHDMGCITNLNSWRQDVKKRGGDKDEDDIDDRINPEIT